MLPDLLAQIAARAVVRHFGQPLWPATLAFCWPETSPPSPPPPEGDPTPGIGQNRSVFETLALPGTTTKMSKLNIVDLCSDGLIKGAPNPRTPAQNSPTENPQPVVPWLHHGSPVGPGYGPCCHLSAAKPHHVAHASRVAPTEAQGQLKLPSVADCVPNLHVFKAFHWKLWLKIA